MGWKKLVILSVLISLFQNCFFKGYRTNEFGVNRPIKNKFTLGQEPYKLASNEIINVNAVYVKTDSIYNTSATTKKKELALYNVFLRFFSNGKFIKSSFNGDVKKSFQEFNNLKKALFVGYYRIEDKKLKIEYFTVSAHGRKSYIKNEFKLINDSIEGFKKLKVEGLTGTPDW
ncbi:hypothetical protein [Flavobacterium sp. H122]|uniref:hypothetical protein n=1 Tax=Flavobacterium sp. H122 TaxID=2529860 RepID=UPI0010A99B15|nr:hypothetical protein [Flavobacterium sp. H122]